MAEPIRPSTVLPANRSPFTLLTADGQTLVGEVASPIGNSNGAILCLHPLPTAGGMMDSHIYKKAANRLPDMAGITVVRFNTRGTSSTIEEFKILTLARNSIWGLTAMSIDSTPDSSVSPKTV